MSDLNEKTLHYLFGTKHPELADVKYDFHRKYYKEHHAFRFGRPQIDVCRICEKLEAKDKEIWALCKEKAEVRGIVFNYMQNLPLSKIPVQDMFYLRKLWIYVFCIYENCIS